MTAVPSTHTALQRLLLTLEGEYGSEAVSQQVLRALSKTCTTYRGELSRELRALYEAFLTGTPRMAHIVRDLEGLSSSVTTPESAQVRISELLTKRQEKMRGVTESALPLFNQKRTVLIRSYSGTLLRVLEAAAQRAVKPKVIVAGQERPKTKKVISFLQDRKFEYMVIDEFVVSHVLKEVDLALFGAVALTAEEDLIVSRGSVGILTQLMHAKIPSYVCLSSDKFSGDATEGRKVFIEERTKQIEEVTFIKRYFSHDVASLSLVTGVITERGILSPANVYTLLNARS